MPRHYTLPFRSGDTVCQICDPRHEGRVRAVFNSLIIRVQWSETGWLSDLPARELALTDAPNRGGRP